MSGELRFRGNTANATTVVEQIKIPQEQFRVPEWVFVGDRTKLKSKGQQALDTMLAAAAISLKKCRHPRYPSTHP